MVLTNVIVDVTIPCRSFVFGQSRAKVSAGFTNVRSLAVAAFDLVYCSLSVLRLCLSLTSVSSRRKVVIGLCNIRYSRCRNRARVDLSVGISVTVSVPSNKVRVVTQLYNIGAAHKPITTLRRLLTNVKDKNKLEDRQGAVYRQTFLQTNV